MVLGAIGHEGNEHRKERRQGGRERERERRTERERKREKKKKRKERGMEEGSYLIEYIKIEKSQKLSDYQTNKMILFLSKIKFYWNSQ